jgi:hypothetical protein
MIELEAEIVGEGVGAVEPMIEAVEEIRIGAIVLQLLARHWMASGAGAIEHEVHVDENLVSILELGEALHFHPEIGVLHAGDVRDEAALLEIAAREGAVEIVDNGGAERLRLTVGGVRHGFRAARSRASESNRCGYGSRTAGALAGTSAPL